MHICDKSCSTAGLTIQANLYYKALINWTSQKVKDTFASRNAFDFINGTSYYCLL